MREEAAAPTAAPVINITNSNQTAQAAVVERLLSLKKKKLQLNLLLLKKKEGDEFKEEAPKW